MVIYDVAPITPMNRGLKATCRLQGGCSPVVAPITPMNRGLKELVYQLNSLTAGCCTDHPDE
mgnify:CR=1 FL=1